jgi:hypothetical protein
MTGNECRVQRGRFKPVGTVALGLAQISVKFFFPNIQTTSKHCNSNQKPSQVSKMFKLCMWLYLNMMNNFLHWWNFKLPLDLML